MLWAYNLLQAIKKRQREKSTPSLFVGQANYKLFRSLAFHLNAIEVLLDNEPLC